MQMEIAATPDLEDEKEKPKVVDMSTSSLNTLIKETKLDKNLDKFI